MKFLVVLLVAGIAVSEAHRRMDVGGGVLDDIGFSNVGIPNNSGRYTIKNKSGDFCVCTRTRIELPPIRLPTRRPPPTPTPIDVEEESSEEECEDSRNVIGAPEIEVDRHRTDGSIHGGTYGGPLRGTYGRPGRGPYGKPSRGPHGSHGGSRDIFRGTMPPAHGRQPINTIDL